MSPESQAIQARNTIAVKDFLTKNFHENLWLSAQQTERLGSFLASRTDHPIALKSRTNPPILLITEWSWKCLILWLGIDRFFTEAPDLDLVLEKIDGEYHRIIRTLFSQYETVRDYRIKHEDAIREATRKNLNMGWFHLHNMDTRVVAAIRESGGIIEEKADGIHIKAAPGYGIFVNIHPNDADERKKYNTKAIWEEFVISHDTIELSIDENNFEDDTIFGKRTNLFSQKKTGTPDEKERNTFMIRPIRADERMDYIEERERTWEYPKQGFSVTTQENSRFFCKSITTDGQRAEFYRTKWGESLPINDTTENDDRAGKTPNIIARYFRFPDGGIAVMRGTPGDRIPPRISFAHIHEYPLDEQTHLSILTESQDRHGREFPSGIIINGVRGDYAGQQADDDGKVVSYFIMPDDTRISLTLPENFPNEVPRVEIL